ncbi:hypothetical protein WICPIJ_009200 [Wickerhamomyces pijperi]|uniref:Autophagy-related protein 14 n=1 Tax=Wickerhamomyces pijperi TaxID=599730 RepID=A0A9P8TES2_WICPI|nr:hypothetical protein WICPIJ_009200 [Wickerhamomyces pijperi]
MKCGLCQTPTQVPLLCPSCTTHQLLPLRIKLLETINTHDKAKQLIDIILKDHCVHGANYSFIRQVIQGEIKWEELNQGGKDGLSVGKDSVIALASQLLTLDTRLISKDITKIRRVIEALRKTIEELEAKEKQSDDIVCDFTKSMNLQDNEENETVELEQVINSNTQILKQIQHSQSLLYHELIHLYIIKKKKLLNSSNSIIMISFTPVISIPQILDLNRDVINFSFQIMTKFLRQLSNILNLTLPYEITYNAKSIGTSQPEILKFQLYLPPDVNKLHELPNFQLKLFLNAISRLSINFYKVLQRLDLDSGITHYTQLFKIDEMVFKLAHTEYEIPVVAPVNNNNTRGNKLNNDEILVVNGEKKIDVDVLTLKMYKFITGRINRKSNEWHLVKEGSFEDLA